MYLLTLLVLNLLKLLIESIKRNTLFSKIILTLLTTITKRIKLTWRISQLKRLLIRLKKKKAT